MRVKNQYGLTQQMENFCNLYVYGDDLISGNATQCYKKAYNIGKTTKDATINHMAHELMKNPKITKRIEMFNEQLADIWRDDAKSQKKRILNRLWQIAEQDNSQNVGALRLISQATEDFFKDNTIKTEQTISITDSIQDLDLLITEISKDDNVIKLFNKDDAE